MFVYKNLVYHVPESCLGGVINSWAWLEGLHDHWRGLFDARRRLSSKVWPCHDRLLLLLFMCLGDYVVQLVNLVLQLLFLDRLDSMRKVAHRFGLWLYTSLFCVYVLFNIYITCNK